VTAKEGAGSSPYAFQLTIDVRADGHAAYRAYKLETLRHLGELPGHRWTLLLAGDAANPDRYYQFSQFDSEAALDASMNAPAVREVVARVRPYRYMTRSPARRDVMTVLLDRAADAPAGAARWCSRLHHRPPSELETGRLVDRLPSPLQDKAAGIGRRLLLRGVHDRAEVVALAVRAGPGDGRQGLDGSTAEPGRGLCEVVLDLPPRHVRTR